MGIAYEGVAIPLFWEWLPKGGNASGREHSAILQRFLRCFDASIIAGVLADRELAQSHPKCNITLLKSLIYDIAYTLTVYNYDLNSAVKLHF